MKKIVLPLFFVCMGLSIFHVYVFAGPEKLVKKLITNQLSTTNQLVISQQTAITGNSGLRDFIGNRLSQNVRAAFFARWNPGQRATFRQITFPAPSTQNTVVVNAVSNQNSGGAPFDSAQAVRQIVSRLRLIIGNNLYERLDTQQTPQGIIFTPIFLQDSFVDSDSESDEVMGEAAEESNDNQDEMVIDSADENSDDEIDIYDFISTLDDQDLEKYSDEQDDQED